MKKITILITTIIISFSLFFTPSYAAAVIPTENTTNKVLIPDSASLQSALANFKSLSRKEKKERIKLAKKEMEAPPAPTLYF